MDLFEGHGAQNLILMFYSDDDGKNWRYLTDLYPFYWVGLFYHNNVLYILGLTTEYGNLQIACSKDGGESWSEPVTLFYGSNVLCRYGGVHRAPMQLIPYRGRLYTSCEYGCWGMHSHLPAILSIDEDADPMVADNWVRSAFLPFEGKWKEESDKQVADKQGDTIEGNIVAALDGNLYNIMRWRVGSLLRLKVNTEDIEAAPEFVGIDEAPVSNSMFRIVPHKDKYFLITNRKTDVSAKYVAKSYRTVLSVYETHDLKHFTLIKDIINHEEVDPSTEGFQYPSFVKEDSRILLSIRAAFNKPYNHHNANYMLFYRLDIND